MNYFVKEINEDEKVKNTAGVKAREDVEDILNNEEFQCINIKSLSDKRVNTSKIQKLLWHYKLKKIWTDSMLSVKSGDVVLIQIPVIEHTIFLSNALKKTKKKGVKIIFLVHYLDSLRYAERSDIGLFAKLRIKFEDKVLFQADDIIAHNNRMATVLKKKTKDKCNIISLKLFDYLVDNKDEADNVDTRFGLDKPVVIAGTLRRHKANYVYQLPQDVNFNLYGVGYEEDDDKNIKYYGAFPPEMLPFQIEGSFGLVWDGDSVETCSGTYGRYLKINNPHKVSLYMASGIPVIIWKEAALAKFIIDNNCGIAVDSLNEIAEKISEISVEEYEKMLSNVNRIRKKVNGGYFLKKAVSKYLKK